MNGRQDITEHDGEPIPGLPGELPAGETILWQGSPEWRGIARRALFVRGIAVYFGLLGVLHGIEQAYGGQPALAVMASAGMVAGVGLLPVALLVLFAWLSARTTMYTITSRRIVMRVGVALPMTINIPFVLINQAQAVHHPDGTGDLVVTLAAPHRVAWLAIWPHVRPFRIKRPEPVLRALRDAPQAARILARALAAAGSAPVPAIGAMQGERQTGHAEALA